MKTGSLITLFLISVTFLLSGTCNKNDDIPLVTNPCWQAFSPLGADVNGLLLCDKTKPGHSIGFTIPLKQNTAGGLNKVPILFFMQAIFHNLWPIKCGRHMATLM